MINHISYASLIVIIRINDEQYQCSATANDSSGLTMNNLPYPTPTPTPTLPYPEQDKDSQRHVAPPLPTHDGHSPVTGNNLGPYRHQGARTAVRNRAETRHCRSMA